MPRVLIVDDDPDILALIDRRVRAAGYDAVPAESGEAALSLVAGAGTPDVAVIDVSMPGISGLELAEVLRARSGLHALPIVFLSAGGHQHEVDAGVALGAIYRTKPFATADLVAGLETALSERSSS